jgi:hypothetical protein
LPTMLMGDSVAVVTFVKAPFTVELSTLLPPI